ncbi:Carbon monoxide dehydrogenase subunit G (CoxG) [Pigmentiphaga humi]|uniref:Carbon monoxide dehydrogenase subunit G (CoxG) n=1 Tax=Pigmentiphaga humi TaxID=2478468 RepID=A0A3P4B5C0_9BURK|nr:carbon monoxide dehydrogenase subunit G [Pigmentiphaga humi]VCU71499.1 Carbon monoxide dehydrogenase subunit G (CoxG) [Pigmentiphaga humi]
MEFSGSQTIAAPRDLVWQCLNDPAMLQASVPGCESLVPSGDDAYDATVVAAIGPVKARFTGSLTLSDKVAGTGFRLAGQGTGGVAGFGRMIADVRLADAQDGTLLTYEAKAEVGGKLAQIGARLIQSAANKIAADFFKRFNANVSARATQPVDGTDAAIGGDAA